MDTRLKAAEAILERGVRFRLPAPFFKRWLKKDYMTIRHLKAGTILEISRIVIAADLENAVLLSDYQLLKKAVEPCARCIAVAILNDRRKIEQQADRLTRRLLWDISAESLIDVFLKIVVMNRTSDFTTITKYFLLKMTTMLERKNLGHDETGS